MAGDGRCYLKCTYLLTSVQMTRTLSRVNPDGWLTRVSGHDLLMTDYHALSDIVSTPTLRCPHIPAGRRTCH